MSNNPLFYHEQVGLPIRVAGVLGITGAAFFAGQAAATSYIFTPALLEAPAPLLIKQWQALWERVRPSAIASLVIGVIFGGLAYNEKPDSSAFKLYATSAALIGSTIPYSIALMGPTTKKLNEKSENLASAAITDTAAEAGVAKEETTHFLVDQWAAFNLGRAALTAAAAVVGLWANVNSLEVVGFESVKLATGANRMG